MATPVYSTLFIAAAGVGISTGYVVPSGKLAIVRDVAVLFESSPSNTACSVYEPGTNTHCFYHLQLNPFEFVHLDCRQVFDQGATIAAASAGPNFVHCRVSGYLLDLP